MTDLSRSSRILPLSPRERDGVRDLDATYSLNICIAPSPPGRGMG